MNGAQQRRRAQLRSICSLVPTVRNSPTELWVGSRNASVRKKLCGIRSWLTRMTPLVSEPVIIGVVGMIERVEKDLEAPYGWLLWQVKCGHIGKTTRTASSSPQLPAHYRNLRALGYSVVRIFV